jgi:hypothetical protein
MLLGAERNYDESLVVLLSSQLFTPIHTSF